MNFEGIEFMGRSFSQEYLNQKHDATYDVVEINMPIEVEKMFSFILKVNGHDKV